MARSKANQRLRAPLMYAFRSAARAGDSKKHIDLRDESGERVIASRRAVATKRRSLSDAALKSLLAEDLSSLLNSINLESADPELLDGLEHVKRSILNYGLPDLSNKTVDETARISSIRYDLETALKDYEPRLLPGTLHIERDEAAEDDLSIRFIVRSDMRADPVPTSVEFVTELDLESGEFKIGRV